MNKKHLLISIFFAIISLNSWGIDISKMKETDSDELKSCIPESALQALTWRNIGPYRGGRVTAVAGHKDQPFTYFMGATGGGVWKTNDAGNNWENISDGYFKTSSVGAISVAENSPNVVYVGMGESPIRAVKSSHGDGVYKSTDGGTTWKHMGLELTRHISKICIHPKNPDIVYVAAQGTAFAKTNERGIYKSTNGGKTWENILFINETTGANDICIDVNNPDILYVAMWDHFRHPWQLRSGGPGSSIYKTTDGGENWEKLTKNLPAEMGKIGIAVSPANSNRIWAIIEAENGGLFRSDDRGKNWKLMNGERVIRTRAWYYMHIFADPLDEETVYVLNAPMMKSTDGGEHFTRVITPHGDNHDLWISPANNKIMVEGNDGGANVSFNGGETWSTQENQPTAQFYRVNTDNKLFYKVYGGQQDNTTVAIASRTRHSGIGRMDWFSCGGAENSSITFDSDNPVFIYATGGRLTEYNTITESTRNIGVYPRFDLASDWANIKYRFNWNAPILLSTHNKEVLYHAAQLVLKSEDRGSSWKEISPDLTLNQKDKQVPGCVPFTNEGAGGELYNTISYLAECPHQQGTLWVGTDDGLVHTTNDDGKNWQNVSPKNLGEAIINTIEVSPHNPNIVYLSVLKHKVNDLHPYIYKTEDAGKSWEMITTGIADEDYVRVVREDPVRKGLLFAGTFSGVYYSVNGGNNWKSLKLNLPIVPVTDLKIQHNDLVAATEGRAFWILDDITPLRELAFSKSGDENYLYKPSDAYLISQKRESANYMAPNPPDGASIFFNIAPSVKIDSANISISIFNKNDSIIRELITPKSPKIVKGLNRITWDLRKNKREIKSGYFFYPGYDGIKVMPGQYRIELSVNNEKFNQLLMIKADPEYPVSEEYFEQQQILEGAFSSLTEMHMAVSQLQNIRNQINSFLENIKAADDYKDIMNLSESILVEIATMENKITQPKQTTIQDVINFRSKIDTQYGYLIEQIDEAGTKIVYGAKNRFNDLEDEWRAYKNDLDILYKERLFRLNKIIKERDMPHIIAEYPF